MTLRIIGILVVWIFLGWLFVYSPLMLYAVNKEVNFVPQVSQYLYLDYSSVTDNHWSVREEAE